MLDLGHAPLVWFLIASFLVCLAQADHAASKGTAETQPNSGASKDAVLAGARDIATCGDLAGAQATAKLIDKIPGTVFAVGDLAYADCSDEEFARCYGPTWGRFRERTRPAPGNHEYHSDGAWGYPHYFGAAAGDPKTGSYGYDLGAWHIIVLNSECEQVEGCDAASVQGQWLKRDSASTRRPALWRISISHCSVPAQRTATIP